MKHEDIEDIRHDFKMAYAASDNASAWEILRDRESVVERLLDELAALRDRTRWRNFGDERPTHGQVCVVISHGHQLVARFDENGPDWDSLPGEHRRWSRSAQYENRWAPYPLPEAPR